MAGVGHGGALQDEADVGDDAGAALSVRKSTLPRAVEFRARFAFTSERIRNFFAGRTGAPLQPWAAAWTHDAEFAGAAVALVRPSVLHYLVQVKRRGRALDSVAHFHLRNGACIFRLNALADCSLRGSGSSCAFMVNYRYQPALIEARAARYETTGAFDAPEMCGDAA